MWLNVGVREVRWRNLDKAVMTLYSILPLPQAVRLYDWQAAPSALEILSKECGYRNEYDPTQVIARLDQCHLGHKWIEHLVVESPDEAGEINIFVKVVGRLQLFI